MVYLAQNRLLRHSGPQSVRGHLDQEQEDLEVVVGLEVPWVLPLKADLELVRPLRLSFSDMCSGLQIRIPIYASRPNYRFSIPALSNYFGDGTRANIHQQFPFNQYDASISQC